MKESTKNVAKNRFFLKALSVVALFLVISFVPSMSASEIKLDLHDQRLEAESDWAMYLDVQEMKQTLNYPNSTLHPLSRVRVSFRSFPRTSDVGSKKSESKTYEELWYHHRTPVSSRRFMEPEISAESLGLIVIGPCDGKKEHSDVLANALIRLMIDLQFKKAVTSIVLVPEANYDEIATGLNYYNFSTDYKLGEGKRMSIHLCSAGSTKEGYFFLGK